MIGWGSLFLLLFLMYDGLWLPLTEKIERLRTSIRHNQSLLLWMQQADQRIQLLEKNHPFLNKLPQDSQLSDIQHAINQSGLAKQVTQLRQAENHSIQLIFQKVDFELLINWLIPLWKNQHIYASQITLHLSDTPGSVSATLLFTNKI